MTKRRTGRAAKARTRRALIDAERVGRDGVHAYGLTRPELKLLPDFLAAKDGLPRTGGCWTALWVRPGRELSAAIALHAEGWAVHVPLKTVRRQRTATRAEDRPVLCPLLGQLVLVHGESAGDTVSRLVARVGDGHGLSRGIGALRGVFGRPRNGSPGRAVPVTQGAFWRWIDPVAGGAPLPELSAGDLARFRRGVMSGSGRTFRVAGVDRTTAVLELELFGGLRLARVPLVELVREGGGAPRGAGGAARAGGHEAAAGGVLGAVRAKGA